MAKIILVKHGKTEWNSQNRLQGSLDIPLSGEGKKEARKLSQELANHRIDAIISSPISCCIATADEIATPRSIKIKKMNEFCEVNLGMWQGLLLKDVKKRYKKQYGIWKTSPTSVKPPRGESAQEAYDRVINAMHKIMGQHRGSNVCLVSHEIILSMIKCYLKKIDLEKLWEINSKGALWEDFEI